MACRPQRVLASRMYLGYIGLQRGIRRVAARVCLEDVPPVSRGLQHLVRVGVRVRVRVRVGVRVGVS